MKGQSPRDMRLKVVLAVPGQEGAAELHGSQGSSARRVRCLIRDFCRVHGRRRFVPSVA